MLAFTGRGTTNATSVRVLSYNVFLRTNVATDRETSAQNDYKDERLTLLIDEQLDKFDIILLQETWGALDGGRKRRLVGYGAKDIGRKRERGREKERRREKKKGNGETRDRNETRTMTTTTTTK